VDNNGADQAAREAAIQEATQAEVRIMLEKKAGETTFRRHIEASDARAALNGIAILIVEYARLMRMEVSKVLSVLAVSLLAPALREENAEHEKSGE
jgi:hypothetical protein